MFLTKSKVSKANQTSNALPRMGPEPLCRETAAVLCIMAKSDTAMTALGQKRRFTSQPGASGLPLSTDILRPPRHVSNVPKGDPAILSASQ